MDVGSWLRALGLGQYEAAFRDNDIDGAVLPKLTLDDLKDLGVAAVGHRRKMMSAIEALNAPSAAPASPPTPPSGARQLTVMFCDLVGSTALSARLDPEDMRQVIRAYQDACSGVVARYDGFVAKFFGDGILAYFGFPRAHEDDAARAVHAGSGNRRSRGGDCKPARAKSSPCAIGIATGLVVAGDIVGQGSAQEQVVVGDTPNLAARLQGLAECGRRRRVGSDPAADRRPVPAARTWAGTRSRVSPSRSRPMRRSACPRARAVSTRRMRRG